VVGDNAAGACTIDPNASLPATGGGATPPPLTFSTTKADDLLLWVGGSDSETIVNPVGFTSIGSVHIFPTNVTECYSAFMQVSAQQNNVSLTYTGITDMVAALTAETADALSKPSASFIGFIG
jgi:hypothetical protein